MLALLLLSFLPCAVAGATPVAVTGATGKLGRHAVEQLVAAGHPVRCLVRCDPAATASRGQDARNTEVAAWLATLPGVELIKGEVTDRQAVGHLLQGCKVCLALHGVSRLTKLTDWLPWFDESQEPMHARQVNCEAISLLLSVAEEHHLERLVRVSGKGEDPFSITSILINAIGSMSKAWNFEGERRLRAGKLDYTIIRPGFMGDVDATLDDDKALALVDDGGELKVTAIPYRSVADLCIRCLDYPQAARATLVAMTQPQPGPRSWEPLLATVKADRRTFAGPEMLEKHYLAVRGFGASIAAVLATLTVLLLNR